MKLLLGPHRYRRRIHSLIIIIIILRVWQTLTHDSMLCINISARHLRHSSSNHRKRCLWRRCHSCVEQLAVNLTTLMSLPILSDDCTTSLCKRTLDYNM